MEDATPYDSAINECYPKDVIDTVKNIQSSRFRPICHQNDVILPKCFNTFCKKKSELKSGDDDR